MRASALIALIAFNVGILLVNTATAQTGNLYFTESDTVTTNTGWVKRALQSSGATSTLTTLAIPKRLPLRYLAVDTTLDLAFYAYEETAADTYTIRVVRLDGTNDTVFKGGDPLHWWPRHRPRQRAAVLLFEGFDP